MSRSPSSRTPCAFFYSICNLCSPRPAQSTLFRFSILRTFRLLRVFRPFRYNNTLLLSVLHPLPRPPALITFSSTIEVMYLSFRRSQHALLALSFFVLMVLVVFSTLLSVLPSSYPLHPSHLSP